jgi:GT2 family glycosyltransferase
MSLESSGDRGRPDVSVIIVAYQVRELVDGCLRSLRASTGGVHWRAYLVENGDDGTAAHVREHFPEVTVFEPGENLGFPRANNLALERIAEAGEGGRYTLLLNPDTVVEPETLATMVRFMDEHPEAGAATCRVDLASGGLDWACHRGFPRPWAALTYFLGFERLFPRSRWAAQYHLRWHDLDTTHEIDAPTGAFFMVRDEVLKQVGLLDPAFFMFGEDLDWAFRIRAAGWRIYYHPATRIVHYKGASSGLKRHSARQSRAGRRQRSRSARHFADSMRIFYDKHLAPGDPLPVRLLVRGGISLHRNVGRLRHLIRVERRTLRRRRG